MLRCELNTQVLQVINSEDFAEPTQKRLVEPDKQSPIPIATFCFGSYCSMKARGLWYFFKRQKYEFDRTGRY